MVTMRLIPLILLLAACAPEESVMPTRSKAEPLAAAPVAGKPQVATFALG